MNASGEKFAKLLTQAVYRIRTLESKTVRIVQDELGYALGKKGGSSIEHWRKGFIPSKQTDTSNLAKEIIRRSDLTAVWLHDFLSSASYPQVVTLTNELFPASVDDTATETITHAPLSTELVTASEFLAYNNLPPQPTAFIGRKKELVEINKQLQDMACKLLTLTGPGGIGKTRLAIQAAQQVVANGQIQNDEQALFRHGVCFVSLASLSSVDFMISAIAEAINFSFFSGEDHEEQLVSFLREKHLLIIIDNLEHLLDGIDVIAHILLQAPNVKVIATSRERLNLRGEWVMEIQGMDYPSLEELAEMMEELETAVVTHNATDIHAPPINPTDYSAIHLFYQSAQRVSFDFDPMPNEQKFIVEICKLVEGIPLAIELAASWARVLSCEEIASEIKQSYDFLETSWRDMPERHRSLQTVFDYSWNLLSRRERDTMRKLSVFKGGFQRESATQVANASLMSLTNLVDKSFLYRNTAGSSRGVRYEMHDLLRQYAQEKLNDDLVEQEATQDKHCHHFAEFVAEQYRKITQGRQIETLNEMSEEIENIRAGWRWAVTKGLTAVMAQYTDALFYFYDVRSWIEEGVEMFETAVSVLNLDIKMNGQQPSETLILYARLLARHGRFCYRVGKPDKARQYLEQALVILEEHEQSQEIAFVYNQLGYIAYRLGQHSRSIELCEYSIRLCREHKHHISLAEALQVLGEVAEVKGEYTQAKQLHEEALVINESINNRRGIATSLNRLGHMAWRLGEYQEAKTRCQESLSIGKELGDRRGIAMAFKNLGNIYSDLDDHHRAQRYYRRGLRISNEIGHRWGIAAFLNNLAMEAWELQDFDRGRNLCLESLEIWRELGYQLGMASTLETLGSISASQGQLEEARSYFIEALTISIEIHTKPLALDIMVGLANIAARRGYPKRAIEVLAFIRAQPTADQETQGKIDRVYHKIYRSVSKDIAEEAEKNGRSETFENIAYEVLGEIEIVEM